MKWPKEYNCPRCGDKGIKNGHRLIVDYICEKVCKSRKQCFKCKNCGYQYTSDYLKIKPIQAKLLAAYLYSCGMKQCDIAPIFNVSNTAIHYWIKDFLVNKSSITISKRESIDFFRKNSNIKYEKRFWTFLIDPINNYSIIEYSNEKNNIRKRLKN